MYKSQWSSGHNGDLLVVKALAVKYYSNSFDCYVGTKSKKLILAFNAIVLSFITDQCRELCSVFRQPNGMTSNPKQLIGEKHTHINTHG